MTTDANELLKRAVQAHAEVLKPEEKDNRTLDEVEQNFEHGKGKKK